MISIKEVKKLHQTLIKRFGGAYGIRDKTALESALARPVNIILLTDNHYIQVLTFIV